MKNDAKNKVATQKVRLEGKLSGWDGLAPIKIERISSDNPAYKSIIKQHHRVIPIHLQDPVTINNRFSPLCTLD